VVSRRSGSKGTICTVGQEYSRPIIARAPRYVVRKRSVRQFRSTLPASSHGTETPRPRSYSDVNRSRWAQVVEAQAAFGRTDWEFMEVSLLTLDAERQVCQEPSAYAVRRRVKPRSDKQCASTHQKEQLDCALAYTAAVRLTLSTRLPRECCLTLRSRRGPTASHQAREAVRHIIRLAGLASYRWPRLTSNVRPHENNSFCARSLECRIRPAN
jgi:hypothetical protein